MRKGLTLLALLLALALPGAVFATDTDGDLMPDDWEIANGLDYQSALDADDDDDSDTIENVNEYFEGTDPQSADLVGVYGLWSTQGYWCDYDADGYMSPVDRSALYNAVRNRYVNWSYVYPSNGQTMDIDGDGFLAPADLTLWDSMVANNNIPDGSGGSRPDSIARLTNASMIVDPGDLVEVAVQLLNESGYGQVTNGFPVVFSIASADCTATLFGGRGEDGSGERYDLTDSDANDGEARVVVLVGTDCDTDDDIVIDAHTHQVGSTAWYGRYAPALSLSAAATLTVQ